MIGTIQIAVDVVKTKKDEHFVIASRPLSRHCHHRGAEVHGAHPAASRTRPPAASAELDPTTSRSLAERAKKLNLKLNKVLDENSSLNYGESPAIQEHTVLPATRHK